MLSWLCVVLDIGFLIIRLLDTEQPPFGGSWVGHIDNHCENEDLNK